MNTQGGLSGGMSGSMGGGMSGGGGVGWMANLPYKSLITFAKNYALPSADADYSVGNRGCVMSRATSATNPAGYTTASGIFIPIATTNTLRQIGGYYKSTGFTPKTGALVEASATNLVPKSYTMNDATWTATDITPADGAAVDITGGSNAASLTASGANGTILLASAVTARTYSVYLKRKTGTGNIYITANSGSTWTAVTLTTEWARFNITRASASQTCGIKIETSGDAVYAYGNQFETTYYPTSLIVTTNGALTRNADVVKYLNAGNATAIEETIFMHFTPLGGDFASDSVIRRLLGSDTKDRMITKSAAGTRLAIHPNNTDTSSSSALATTTPLKDISYVFTGVVRHTPNYAEAYMDGVLEGSDDTPDFVTPSWGDYFYVGSNAIGTNQLNGIVHSIVRYRCDLSSSVIAKVAALLKAV